MGMGYHVKDNQSAFPEEKNRLFLLLALLSEKIQYLLTNKPYPDVHPYSTGGDQDEREDLKYKKACNYKSESEISHLSGFKDCPYFARMDFHTTSEDTEYQKIYIGKKGLLIDGEQLVFDWRSPVGERYYLKSETEFSHGVYKYTLLLRRALNINQGQLVSYNDEYIYGDEISDAGITDPFLINALREKRGVYHLTNIIKTIQENQNNIIQFPAKSSFIVQGCAGSGKTMIMLHRLSRILFNNPQSDLSKIKIITPNHNFNMHINALCEELELEKIERYKIDDYYVYLLKLYAPQKWQKTPVVQPDSALDERFVKEIYSEAFYSGCATNYANYIGNIYRYLSVEAVNELCAARGLAQSYSLQKNDHDSIKGYERFINRMFEEDRKSAAALEEKLREINAQHAKIAALQNEPSFRAFITAYQDESTNLHSVLKQIAKQRDDCVLTCALVCKSYALEFCASESDDRLESYMRILNKNDDRIRQADFLAQKLSDVHAVHQESLRTYSAILDWYSDQMENELHELQTTYEEITKLPFWKIVQKQRLLANVRKKEQQFSQNQQLYAKATEAIEALEARMNRLSLDRQELKSKTISAADQGRIQNCFNREKDLLEEKARVERELIQLDKDHERHIQSLTELENGLKKLQTESEELKTKLLTNNEVEFLKEKLYICQQVNFENVYTNTIHVDLNALSQSYTLPKSKTPYRYHLFLELLCHSMFKGKLLKNDRFLSIDEGQDLAATEYRMLKAVHGEDLILNVYGDTHQAIFSKSITAWSQVHGFNETFWLNENYRNTEQITEFCNTELGLSFTSIGISGESVRKVPFSQAERELKRLNIVQQAGRYAVLVKNYKDPSVDTLIALGCSKGELRDGTVSLLSVEDAKGLEFENVFVIDETMSKNEKYIAYTRALRELIVVRMQDVS